LAASQCTENLIQARAVGCTTDDSDFLFGLLGALGACSRLGKLSAHILEKGGALYLVAWRCIIHHTGEARSERRVVLDGCVFRHRNPREKPF
jgi:hypothetical protein